MFKKFVKSIAAVCALTLTVSLFGCADTSWIAKVDGVTVPSGLYLMSLMNYRSYVLQYAAATSSSVSDPWSVKVGDSTALTWTINQAIKSCEEYAEVELLCQQRKITLTNDEISQASSYASSALSENAAYKKNGVTQNDLKRYYGDQYLISKLFTSYYGTGGDKAVSDADLKKYFNENYVKIKHIVLKTTDSSGNTLASDKLSQVKSQADSIYAQASGNQGATFDALMKQYSEDKDSSGNINEATGYIFSKTSATQQSFDTTFVNAAFSMKEGEIKEVQASYGYDILYKLPISEDTTYLSSNKTSVLGEMKSSDFQSIIDNKVSKAKLVKNNGAINHYSPKKIQDASSAS